MKTMREYAAGNDKLHRPGSQFYPLAGSRYAVRQGITVLSFNPLVPLCLSSSFERWPRYPNRLNIKVYERYDTNSQKIYGMVLWLSGLNKPGARSSEPRVHTPVYVFQKKRYMFMPT